MKIARTKADMKRIVEQWKHAGPELEAFRRKELAEFDHARNWRLIDGLLDSETEAEIKSESSGMVEMQRWFMKAARKQRTNKR